MFVYNNVIDAIAHCGGLACHMKKAMLCSTMGGNAL